MQLAELQSFLWIVLGILLSIAVPIAIKVLKPQSQAQGFSISESFKFFKPYLQYGAASIVLGIVVLATIKYTGGNFTTWYQALMAGYLGVAE